MVDLSEKNELYHYGMPRRSGRYPWGSGENPYQHENWHDFLSRIEEYKKQGLSETEIAKELGLKTTEYRVEKSQALALRRAQKVATAKELQAQGLTLQQIAEQMGYKNDSSVRSLLNTSSEARMNQAQKTADFLKKQIDEKGIIDVGIGVEQELGISRTKMDQALYILQQEGYKVYGGRVPQITNPSRQTILQVACPPGTEHKEFYEYNISSVTDYKSEDGGDTYHKAFEYPSSMDSSRLQIRYAEEGGSDKDGVIEIRRGVEDLSLGESHYAQVRILVDGTRYIKGMAIYSDDMPDGVDVIFNTNKSSSVSKMEVLKKISDDPENPFGSLIKEDGGQSHYVDSKTGEEKLSLINKRAEEGDWNEWSDHLPSQFLSKQKISLIQKQLNLSLADKQAELEEIESLTNPTVKKKLLASFAEDCDAAAVSLQAAALPRQKYQVILPVTSLKDTEIYAPNYTDGEQVALIRFPHGGTFEIPILTVNNKQAEAKSVLGNVEDAVGINSKVAARLSGADFDGDTVMVIPTNSKVKITSTSALKGLEGFDPKMEYGTTEEQRKSGSVKLMTNTQNEMGRISNLITDMTLKGATDDELARAVRHSMVVIDAEKHKLDYKQSEIDNGIDQLKQKYQAHEDGEGYGGASTLISRAKSQTSVVKRQGSPKIDEETGELVWKTATDATHTDKNGKTVTRMQRSTKMAETSDAHTLSSGTPVEEVYADYANSLKAMANQARKSILSAGKIVYSASAREAYKEEVASLKEKLSAALLNAPRERQAQVIANAKVKAMEKDNPSMSKEEVKKAKQRALSSARNQVGAKKKSITITDKEWDCIQAGGITENVLSQILNNTDTDAIKQRATPRATNALASAKVAKIKSMGSSGYTTDQIAQAIGCSTSTVWKYLNQ